MERDSGGTNSTIRIAPIYLLFGEVLGHRSERLLWFPQHVWVGCAIFSAAIAFDQAGADCIEVVSGIAIIRVNTEGKGKHKRAVNACCIKYAEGLNQFAQRQNKRNCSLSCI